MAEFVVVSRHFERMCESFSMCISGDGCPLYRCEAEENCADFRRRDPEGFEAVVMKWAAEHPEKTLKDVLLEHFPNAALDKDGEPETCAELLGLGPCPNGGGVLECTNCQGCWNRPAPEEVAE